MSNKILVASANTGTGLWTSICFGFCEIIGKESVAYRTKQKKVLAAANKRLLSQLSTLGEGYKLTDYRVTWSGKLSVTVSALAELDGGEVKTIKESKKCPRCGAPIDDEMLFCGECGAKLK